MNRKQRRATKPELKSGNLLRQPAAAKVPTAAEVFAAGAKHHQEGHLAAAAAHYRQVLLAQPGHADALHLLGVLAYQARHHAVAVDLIRRAIRLNGRSPHYFCSLGNALRDQGKLNEAVASYRQVISIKPDDVEALANLGDALMSLGKLEEAITCYRRAISIKPDYFEVYANLGNALMSRGKLDEAVAAHRQALTIKPDSAGVLSNLGNALMSQSKLDEAVTAYRQALTIKPGYAEVHSNLGVILRRLGKLDEAVAACREAIHIKSDCVEAHTNLGNALRDQGKFEEAVTACREAIRIKPGYFEAYVNLGVPLADQGELDEAIAAYRQAISIKPDHAEAHTNLGNALKDQGRLDEAVAAYRQAIKVNPDYSEARSNLLMCMHYSASFSSADVHAEALQFGRRFDAPLGNFVHNNAKDLRRRLRIGYVSADFRSHPVGYFLTRVLSAHDHEVAEVYCYSNQKIADDLTARLQACADKWRSIVGMSDPAAAALIRHDAIDILIDLSGHTAGNRLTMFALRPAPVQVSWLGYFGTTGLAAMDYILADRFVVLRDEEAFFSEKVWRLPDSYLCFAPHDLNVRVAPPPSLTGGCTTFGCFNNRAKITAHTVRAWAAILRRLEGSRLFLKNKSLADATVAKALIDEFTAYGVPAGRLILEGHSPLAEALAAYNRVDVALDPFPFGGGTTTAEALWMGVPVVTLRGDRWVGRMSESILATVGLANLVTEDCDSYVRTAVDLAGDRSRLSKLYSDLRHMVEASAFCDGLRFARSLEAAYRGMWNTWCVT